MTKTRPGSGQSPAVPAAARRDNGAYCSATVPRTDVRPGDQLDCLLIEGSPASASSGQVSCLPASLPHSQRHYLQLFLPHWHTPDRPGRFADRKTSSPPSMPGSTPTVTAPTTTAGNHRAAKSSIGSAALTLSSHPSIGERGRPRSPGEVPR